MLNYSVAELRINKVEEEFQIEPLRSFLHLLPVSDIPQRRIVDAAVEPCQFAVRIAQLDDGFIGNAQSRFLMLLIICHDS